jgi:hypothetical protein
MVVFWWTTTTATAVATTNKPRRRLQLSDFIWISVPIFILQVVYFHKQLLAPPNNSSSLTVNDIVASSSNTIRSSLDNFATKKTNANYNSTSSTKNRPPDAIFNGYPVHYQETADDDHDHDDAPIHSQFHCVGESYEPPFFLKKEKKHLDASWQHRSCHFELFCFDLDTKDFIIYPQKDNTSSDLPKHADVTQSVFTNTTPHQPHYPYGVSLGGINGKWSTEGIPRLNWFPRVELGAPPRNFYALPANVVMIPFHSLAAFNPGHLVWDDFLPIYTLMQIFGFADQQNDLLMMRYQLPGEGLWAGCDWRAKRSKECAFMLHKFGPLMVRRPEALPITTQNSPNLTIVTTTTGEARKSNLVCARHGLAGLGSLTDHGTGMKGKGHGWHEKDYSTTYNHGRGGQLWRFRNFMMQNLGFSMSPTTTAATTTTTAATTTTMAPPAAPPPSPYLIIFSEKSTATSHRSLDFTLQIAALKRELQKNNTDIDVRIESHQMKQYSLKEQAELVSKAAIYVTGCGGGAVTATFLPKGSSLLLYYVANGGVENNRASGKPARLDWDYFNNMAYTRVHWIPQRKREIDEEGNLFVLLIQHELEIIQREREEYEALLLDHQH